MKKVFISYSHDNDEHCNRVRELANKLSKDGINVIIDSDMLPGGPSDGWPMWSEEQVKEADQILVACTGTYHRRYEAKEELGSGLGRVCEARAIRQLLYNEGGSNEKFRVILFTENDEKNIPINLQPYHHFFLIKGMAINNCYNGRSQNILKRSARPNSCGYKCLNRNWFPHIPHYKLKAGKARKQGPYSVKYGSASVYDTSGPNSSKRTARKDTKI